MQSKNKSYLFRRRYIKDHFSFFDKDKQFLDTFLGKCVSRNVGYVYFRKICKVAFILLHCQAGVEREFSVNKELLVNNMQKKSLISQRIIYDQFSCYRSNLEDYKRPRDVLLSCKSAWIK